MSYLFFILREPRLKWVLSHDAKFDGITGRYAEGNSGFRKVNREPSINQMEIATICSRIGEWGLRTQSEASPLPPWIPTH